jgi:hypothetical protein
LQSVEEPKPCYWQAVQSTPAFTGIASAALYIFPDSVEVEVEVELK